MVEVGLPTAVGRTIRRRRLPLEMTHAVVGCSGGPDSTALLHVLCRLAPKLHLKVTAAHIDHGIRPDSVAEADLVEELARELGVAFTRRRLHLGLQPNLHDIARRARYKALQVVAREVEAHAVAVGHTADDQAETVVQRIVRGAGLTGLGAIQPCREDGVVRPMIDCTRRQVLTYLKYHSLSYVSDPSNCDGRYSRTRARHKILPLLKEENPTVVEALCALADEASELREWLELELEEEPSDSPSKAPGGPGISSYQVPRLRRWIIRKTGHVPSGRQLRDALGLASKGGNVWLRGGWAIIWRNGEWHLIAPTCAGQADAPTEPSSGRK